MAAGTSPQQARAQALSLLGDAHERGEQHRESGLPNPELGIAGARVCQACGAIESFKGLPAAMLKHRKRDYICSGCLRELSGAQPGPYTNRELARIESELARRERRFCEVCAVDLSRSEFRELANGYRVCADCRLRLEGLDRDLDDAVQQLSRRRFARLFGLGGA